MTHKAKVMKHYKGRVELAETYLLALRLILEKYKEKKYAGVCPLCGIQYNCEDCPWYVLGSARCEYIYVIVACGRREKRMAQIERWIKVYEAGIRQLKIGIKHKELIQ